MMIQKCKITLRMTILTAIHKLETNCLPFNFIHSFYWLKHVLFFIFFVSLLQTNNLLVNVKLFMERCAFTPCTFIYADIKDFVFQNFFPFMGYVLRILMSNFFTSDCERFFLNNRSYFCLHISEPFIKTLFREIASPFAFEKN